jgi:signal transduction histidine kinase
MVRYTREGCCIPEESPRQSLSHESLHLLEDQAILLFLSVRELLLNIVKHASVARAFLSLAVHADNTLLIRVQDHGRGFTPSVRLRNAAGDHFGLASIPERLMLLGGRLQVHSSPGQGTLMTLSVL